jgi:hypothetical protein
LQLTDLLCLANVFPLTALCTNKMASLHIENEMAQATGQSISIGDVK